MRNANSKFSLYKEWEQVTVSPKGIRFNTTNAFYSWTDIVTVTLYTTEWDWEDTQSNLEIRFSTGDGFRVNVFQTGPNIFTCIWEGLEYYLPGFDSERAKEQEMDDFLRKEKYLRFLGLLTNFYWGYKPVVFHRET